MIRRLGLGLLGVFLFTNSAWSQVKLEWKFLEGQVKKENTVEVQQKLTIAGMEVDSGTSNRSVSTSTTGKRDGVGGFKVSEKIVEMEANINTQGQNYSFDSKFPDKAGSSALEILRPVHKAMLAQETIMNFDKANQVTSVQRSPENLDGVSDELKQAIKSQIDPENLKRNVAQELSKLPKTAVAKGDTWRQSERVDLGSGQVMTFSTEYAYAGTVDVNGKMLDRITSKVLAVEFALENSPLPFTLKASKLKPTESAGEFLFDRGQGAVVTETSTVRIEGDITFVINGNDLPSKLDLKMKTSSKKS